ncbi:NHL repeat protein [Caballeronia hypogeia]|uniref:NHL repeat protein n=1 Tax=Caballeronia hypogeia TaxID=1777140 RepID=A0A158DQX2_9BURK|nr:hypothetical protein [Caballeronia hypogeia]SAK96903.1 NHL repeat protein [Caballeronia hypogeia]
MIANARSAFPKAFSQVSRWLNCRNRRRSMMLASIVAMASWSIASSGSAQQLFMGDVADNSVKQFDLQTGVTSIFIEPKSAGLNGPTGMIFSQGQLYVVNQNVNTGQRGEVLKFDGATGTFIGKLISSSDINAPFAPRGIVLGTDSSFYVASMLSKPGKCANAGSVNVYNNSGVFQYSLAPDPRQFPHVFHPRGVVFAPDGTLYVTAIGCLDPTDPDYDPSSDPLAGYVLTFRRPASGGNLVFDKVLASNSGNSVPYLHRPEGLVVDNQGNLWVTSFRSDSTAPTDTDKLLKLNGQNGSLLAKIELDTKANKPHPNPPRAPAQAIILGPGGDLFVPISGTDSNTAGELLRCNVSTLQCSVLIKPYGDLQPGHPDSTQMPWYLIFKTSNPATLQYTN